MPPRLDAQQPNTWIVYESGKEADCVRSSSDTGDSYIWKTILGFKVLRSRLFSDDLLKLSNHERVRVRARCGSDHIVGVPHMGHPVSHRLIQSVFEGFRSACNGMDLGSEQLHPKDVQLLPGAVLLAHVHFALQPKEGANGRRGDSVLARSRLGDDPLFSHPAGEQALPDRIVDLVRPGVVQIFALHHDVEAGGLRDPLGHGDRRGATDVIAQNVAILAHKEGVLPSLLKLVRKFLECGHKGLGDIAAAKGSKPAK